jgi:L-alanine-DL-glutamate epimerase-like enolase superfamily enzyme
MTCVDCTAAATDWTWGGYTASCHDCEVRAIAQAPRHIREQAFEQLRVKGGMRAVQDLQADVRAEFERVKALREKAG